MKSSENHKLCLVVRKWYLNCKNVLNETKLENISHIGIQCNHKFILKNLRMHYFPAALLECHPGSATAKVEYRSVRIEYLTLCMLGNFHNFSSAIFFFKINVFE